VQRIARNARAALHYRPTQIWHRVLGRAGRSLTSLAPGPLRRALADAAHRVSARGDLECPAALREFALDPLVSPPERAEELLRGEITHFGVTRALGSSPDWYWERSPAPSHLWRFNLHYHRFLVDATVGALRAPVHANRLLERASALLDHWTSHCTPGSSRSWDAAWSSYPASARVLNAAISRRLLIDVQGQAAEGLRRRIDLLMASNAEFVCRRLERDLGGNHLLRNATALVAAGALFDGEPARKWRALGHRLTLAELGRQVLGDGFHEERTPMYHALLVEDLLVACMGRAGLAADDGLREAISTCAGALGSVVHPDGQIALFNDSAFGVAAPPAVLLRLARQLALSIPSGARDLPYAGYYRFSDGGDGLIFDAGPLGPDHLPAHAHCDALSFELSLDGTRVVVDTGVDRYEAGPERDFQRGTAAHSTLQVAGLEQGEPFGSFRMGRRPRVTGRRIDERTAEGSHDGYGRHGRHRRRIQWNPGRGLSWIDALDGPSEVPVTVRLGLAPWISAEVDGSTALVMSSGRPGLRLTAPGSGVLSLDSGVYCERFGHSTPRRVLCWRGSAGAGIELRFSIERRG
jgi:uncharacterized heparinase superfamily protein